MAPAGKLKRDRNNYYEEEIIVNKLAIAALGIGAAYLMQNKNARDKLMKQVENFTGMTNMNQKSNTDSSS